MDGPIVRVFVPEEWSAARRFREFVGPPFTVDSKLEGGIDTILTHQEKFVTLSELTNDVILALDEDEVEFRSCGVTNAPRSRQLAALLETLAAEQYSILNGLRTAMFSIFSQIPGVQNAKTSRMFRLAHGKAYGRAPSDQVASDVFIALCVQLSAAYTSWFPVLRTIRTITTHGRTGRCYKTATDGSILYARPTDDGYFRIENATGWMNSVAASVRALTETFFEGCFSKLVPTERQKLCGFFGGRPYERLVAPHASLSSDDGRCLSRGWFEASPGLECPLRTACGAFNRPVLEPERSAHYAQAAPA